MHKNSIVIVCGPTAVGKTSFAIQLASLLQTEIISADSRQCFRELSIGVAKPSAEELAAVHHYFINSHTIYEEVNAGIFEQYALLSAEQIFSKNATAVMVGGTGLYIKAFTEGLDTMPAIDPATRQEIVDAYEQYGLEYLQQQVAAYDPVFWQTAEQHNPQRLMRGLEMVLTTGKSITAFRQSKKEPRPFNIIKIGLELPRQQLYQQINHRVDKMIAQGQVNEVKDLLPHRNCNALQTVGYRELFDFFDQKLTLPEAITNIKTNTRQYAKRQLTWFKKDNEITWIHPGDKGIFQEIVQKLSF